MKKISIFMVIALCFSAQAYAVTATTAAGVATVGGETITATAPATLDIARASKGVLFAWSTSATGYSIQTYHTQGTKIYGTSYDSTAMFFNDVGTAYDSFAAPTSSDSDEAFPSSDWTTM